MKQKIDWNRIAQLALVAICAYLLKRHFSAASVDDLGWILAPTAALVKLISGVSFDYESHAGYISGDRSFLIAKSCAGVNFLIAAFLMLSAGRLLRRRSQSISWLVIPNVALAAYLATIAANTTRIAIALALRQTQGEIAGLNQAQIHRLEGIVVYFGFLLLLFAVSEKLSADKQPDLLWQSFVPILVYYAVTLGVPLINGAYREGSDLREHAVAVVCIPLLLILPFVVRGYFKRQLFGKQERRPREMALADQPELGN